MRIFRCALLALMLLSPLAEANEKLAFWDQQRRGANGDGGSDFESWFAAAAGFGIEFVRLSPADWESKRRDVLIGDADHFTELDAHDFARLRTAIDVAHKHGVKIVLTTFSLPGARWRQHNDGRWDYRLWNEERFQDQAIAFWRQLAERLRDHPAVVGYNLLNEPHPERESGITGPDDRFQGWLRSAKGTTRDLNRFYQWAVREIREVDADTPIVLDGCFHAGPDGLTLLEPIADPSVLYSFHLYDPWVFTTWRINKDRFAYPDRMPDDSDEATCVWTLDDLRRSVQPVVHWAKRHDIPARRILAGEFGCDRRVAGAAAYLADVIRVLNENDWHWAFYSFRARDWGGMDYELGTEKLGWKYWEARDRGATHDELVRRGDNSLWSVIKRELPVAKR